MYRYIVLCIGRAEGWIIRGEFFQDHGHKVVTNPKNGGGRCSNSHYRVIRMIMNHERNTFRVRSVWSADFHTTFFTTNFFTSVFSVLLEKVHTRKLKSLG